MQTSFQPPREPPPEEAPRPRLGEAIWRGLRGVIWATRAPGSERD